MVFSLWKYNTLQCFGARNIQVKVQMTSRQSGPLSLKCYNVACWPQKFRNLYEFPLSNGFLAH